MTRSSIASALPATGPLIVNLFGGPGSGKSTMMAGVFSALKSLGVCAEMAPEAAKDFAWENRGGALSCQPYIFGKQLWRIQRLLNAGVEVVVTDSPLLLSNIYWEDAPPSWEVFVRTTHRGFRNLNFFVRRVKAYDMRGRFQTLEEAKALDVRIYTEMCMAAAGYLEVPGDERSVAAVTDRIVAQLSLEGLSNV